MKSRQTTFNIVLLCTAFFVCYANSVSALSSDNSIPVDDNSDERPSSTSYQTGFMLPLSIHSSDYIYKKIKEDSETSRYISYSVIGKSSSGIKDIILVKCSKPGSHPASTIRLLVLCRQHGDEPASTEAMFGLIERLAMDVDPRLESSLANVTLYIIPIVNPDGADSNGRNNANNEDINRDWGYFTQSESLAVDKAIGIIKPHVIIDAHNWDKDDPYNFDCIEIDQKHDTAQSEIIRDLQDKSVKYLNANAYNVHPITYNSYCNMHLAHRYYSSCGILSMLVETHSGDVNNKQDYQMRQGLYSALVHFIVRELSVKNTSIKNLYGSRNNHFNEYAEEQLFYNADRKQHISKHEKAPINAWLPIIALTGLIVMYLSHKRTDNQVFNNIDYNRDIRIVWLQNSDIIDERLTYPLKHHVFGFKKPNQERLRTAKEQKRPHVRAIGKQLRNRHDIHQYRY